MVIIGGFLLDIVLRFSYIQLIPKGVLINQFKMEIKTVSLLGIGTIGYQIARQAAMCGCATTSSKSLLAEWFYQMNKVLWRP